MMAWSAIWCTHLNSSDLFHPGDIVGFHSPVAGKRKWHLCVNAAGWFLHLNSPKERLRKGELEINCEELPGVPHTNSGKSIVSCTMVLRLTADRLELFGAEKEGAIGTETATAILAHIKAAGVLSPFEKGPVIEGLTAFLSGTKK